LDRTLTNECATGRGVHVSVLVVTEPSADPAEARATIRAATGKALDHFSSPREELVAQLAIPGLEP
jgi:hypothetical protein